MLCLEKAPKVYTLFDRHIIEINWGEISLKWIGEQIICCTYGVLREHWKILYAFWWKYH